MRRYEKREEVIGLSERKMKMVKMKERR